MRICLYVRGIDGSSWILVICKEGGQDLGKAELDGEDEWASFAAGDVCGRPLIVVADVVCVRMEAPRG